MADDDRQSFRECQLACMRRLLLDEIASAYLAQAAAVLSEDVYMLLPVVRDIHGQ